MNEDRVDGSIDQQQTIIDNNQKLLNKLNDLQDVVMNA